MPEIVELLVSPVHRYDGRPVAPDEPPSIETRDSIELRAGLGVVGDRYFNRPAHRDAAVTLMSVEALAPWPGTGLTGTRRNVLLRGLDVDSGLGRVLTLDSGEGPVSLRLNRPARPCGWLDLTVGEGAWRGLRGHGGVRCSVLSSGVLHVGPVEITWS